MKLSFGFGANFNKNNHEETFRSEWNTVSDADDFDFELEDEESNAEYADVEYADDAEYSEGEYRETDEEEYIEEEYSEEYTDEEYVEEEYVEDEYSDEFAEDLARESAAGFAAAEYADEEYIEEYLEEYPEEGYSDEIYEDEIFSEEEYSEEYADDEYADDEYYYENDDEEEEEGALLPIFGNSGIVDKLIMFGGVAVLLMALIVGGILIGTRFTRNEDTDLSEVGKQLAQIETIGKSGLLAVSDAQKAALEAAEIVEEIEEEEESSIEYEEEDYKTEVTVKLSMSSIEKDLKIKFINQNTGKLVGNVPFSIQVVDPNGKESLWSDDDMDGIIYKKNLQAGKYEITVNAFEDEKYKKYGLPLGSQRVDVKAEISYEKVDVSNEVKSESQVDVQKEDTKKNETVVESYLTDTVQWVESTATLETYTEVAKTDIVNPLQLAMSNLFVRLSVDNSVSGNTPDTTPTPSPSPDPEESPAPSPTPTPSPMVITLDKKTAIVYVDHPAVITATVENLMEGAKITATSSDTRVALVEVNDKAITVNGVAEGTVNITVNCTAEVTVTEEGENGETTVKTETYEAVPVVCSVVVKPNPEKDTKTVLTDSEDREVYVLEGTEYRLAYYADYFTFSKFYIKGEAKYTGWQTLEGKRYFFDASGKAVTGEQVIQGVKYNFASDGSLVTSSGTLGIDVSKWNGNIDWNAVKNSGVSYVIIRCGYRGSTEGALIKDSKFETNIKGAINAGLKVGVYFFTQAIDKNEAIEEASMVLDCIRNYKISYPVFLDVEASGGRADSIDKATRTEICKTFCATIQKYGYTAGIYANKNWFTEKINTGELSGSYKIWLAQYASAPTYTGRYDMWQYKSTGRISGISGDVDMNLSYLGY